jgi:uncharacterized protein YqhQ
VAFVVLSCADPTTLSSGCRTGRRARRAGRTSPRACSASALFVGYLWLIGRTKDIHRVFEYHGAEHKTIAAYEHGRRARPRPDRPYPKEHVRCGTNFLIIVMIITIFVFTLFGTPGLLWRLCRA